MIDMMWNFPLLPGQAAEWQQYLRRAVDAMDLSDPRQLRPSFRGADVELRERAAKWLGVEAERAWFVDGGHHGALVAMLAAGLAGKSVAVENISYTTALQQMVMLGAKAIGCAYDSEGMLPEALREACAKETVRAVFLMPTVHNPLGIVAGLERRKAIVAVAREFDLLILEDDAYAFMEPDAAAPYLELAPERTFFVRGLSKGYAPQTRTGFLIVPQTFVDGMDPLIRNTSTGTSLVHNAAAMELIEDGAYARMLVAKNEEGAVRNALGREILGDAAQPGARCAWHLWVTWDTPRSAAEVAQVCWERGVMVSGAAGFAAPGRDVPRALRVGLGGEMDRAEIEKGLRMVAEVLGLG
jgi:DNA-binding transcriptional MocR family regulator